MEFHVSTKDILLGIKLVICRKGTCHSQVSPPKERAALISSLFIFTAKDFLVFTQLADGLILVQIFFFIVGKGANLPERLICKKFFSFLNE